MRSWVLIAIAGSLLLVSNIQAQTLTEHAAAAAGATIGTAGGKQVSNAITKIFGQVDETAKKAAASDSKAPAKRANAAAPAAPDSTATEGSVSVAPRRRAARAPVAAAAAVVNPPVLAVRVAEAPPRKEPTAEELASIKVGASESELLAALGAPASRITIPDDGHLVEICQYWANGKPLGTVRLDNGQVVTVEPREN